MVERERETEELATVARARVPAASWAPATYAVAVIAGPDAGKSLCIDGSQPGRVLIGQSEACDLRLTDPLVSRRHVALALCPQGLQLTDLGSTNGTLANGILLHDAVIGSGTILVLGGSELRVDLIKSGAEMPLTDASSFGRVLGASIEMRRLYPFFERLAASEVPVVIEGETGTGKEVLAEALHDRGPRASGPFIVFDCTAAPATLIESALFGHEKGAFTGALAGRKGAFELADGGTLFIDEIGELDLAMQPKLLRAIERSEIQRVGSERWIRVDVRIIAATRRDLDREVQAGRFRDDLFFRLAVARIELPPLRERRGDIGLLARHFWRNLGGGSDPFPEDLLRRFEDYPWPGNVRELQNAVVSRLALGDVTLARAARDQDEGDEPPQSIAPSVPPTDAIERVLSEELPFVRARGKLLEEFERRYVERLLARYDGNVARAASASGIGRRYFQMLRARRAKPSS